MTENFNFEQFKKPKSYAGQRDVLTEFDKDVIKWLVKSGVANHKIARFTRLHISAQTIKKVAPRE